MNQSPTHKPTVAVIGGGISGLSTAFWLLQNNMEAIVLEQTSRPGGIIRSECVDGYLVDHAANCLLNYLPEVNALCDTVGVRDEQIYRSDAARKRYLLKNGHPVPLPQGVREFINTNLLSMKGKARLIAEPLIPRTKPGKEETVSEFVSRRLGREILEQVMEPFIGGTYAGDAGQLCVKSIFPMFSALEQRYGSLIMGVLIKRLRGSRGNNPMHLFSFRHGMETLPRAISTYLGTRFISHSRVKGIEPGGDKTWRIIAERDGQFAAYSADAIVIATPSIEAARLISTIEPDTCEMLKKIEYSPLAVVYTGFKMDDIRHPLDGIGCMVPSREGHSILGTLWNSTLFSGRAADGTVALTNYVGGRRLPEVAEKSEEELLGITLNDLKNILDVKSDPAFVRITRYKRALPQYSIGHQRILKRIEDMHTRIPDVYITGNYLRGISVRDCISYGSRLATRIAKNYGLLV